MIRRATPEDLDALEAIERVCFPGGEFPRALLHRILTRPDAASFVCLEGETVVGSGMVAIEGGRGRILSVAVIPVYRRRGLGRELMEVMERECLRQRVSTVDLEVRADNDAATGLYRSMGYREKRLLSDHYGPGKHGVIMQKALK